MLTSGAIYGILKELLFSVLVFSLCVYRTVGKPQSFNIVPVLHNPLYVPQYALAPHVGVPLNPFYLYYVADGFQRFVNAQIVQSIEPIVQSIGHQFIRVDGSSISHDYPQISGNSEDRDAPARTPTQDEVVFKLTQINFHQDQCGTKGSLVRANDETNVKKDSLKWYMLGDSEDPTPEVGGSVLLKSLVFNGPNTTETEFAKFSTRQIISTKITYGIETVSEEAPWQVAMFINGKFHCGASLITERHVLTAAHCVSAYTNRPNILELSIGDWDLLTTEDGNNIKATVKKVFPHSGFNFFNLQNDIAILELKENVTFTDRIKPICLPPVDLAVEGIPITVTGWGRNEKNLLQTKLRKLIAFAMKNTICADRWSSSGAPRSLIGARTICMDTQFGDSCKGDSGGPAVVEHPTGSGKYVQAGIVSFGSGSCTDFNLPGVYTRVASFRSWIIDNIS